MIGTWTEREAKAFLTSIQACEQIDAGGHGEVARLGAELLSFDAHFAVVPGLVWTQLS